VTHVREVELPWTKDRPVAEITTWQDTELIQETNVRAPGKIRTSKRIKRAAADLRLRPRGRWDRLENLTSVVKPTTSVNVQCVLC
jgi:hypothetical protein